MTKTEPKAIPSSSAKKQGNFKRKKSNHENYRSSETFYNNKSKESISYNSKLKNYGSEKVPTSRSHSNLEITKPSNQKSVKNYNPIEVKSKKHQPSSSNLLTNRSSSAKEMQKNQNTNSSK